jgi:2-amino-4-hydroxy-6-hydroxymethyldihydropteridine diphosphokinase
MLTQPVTACVALGANLGNAAAMLQQAVASLAALPNTQLQRASSLYRTAPHEAHGPDFINAVVLLETRLPALALLDALQSLELACGRERPYHHAPRTLDLDLIFHGDTVLNTPRLTLPHPRWSERAFVLVPLAEVAPECVSPALLEATKDQPIERLTGLNLP